MIGRLWASTIVGCAVVLLAPASALAGNASSCPRNPSPPAGTTPQPPISLAPTEASKSLVWNFGNARDAHSWAVSIRGTPDLEKLDAAGIEVTSGALVRDDNHATIAAPHYSQPKLAPSSKQIRLTLCVDTDGAKPGKYTGTVEVDGASKLQGATVQVSVTAKEGRWWLLALVGLTILLVAGAALSLKGVADYQRDIDGKKDAEDKPLEFSLTKGLLYVWTGDRLIPTVVGLIAGLVAGYLLYSNSETWGEHLGSEWLAMAQAVIAAVGAQALIDGARSNLKAGTGT